MLPKYPSPVWPRPRARVSPSHGRTQAGRAIIDEHRPEDRLPEDDGCGLHSTTVGCFAWDHPTRKASQFPEPRCRCVPSSMRRGASPARTRDGSTSKAARSWGSPESSTTSEAACRRPVIVLPHTEGMNGESKKLPSVSATGMPASWNALVAERAPMVECLTLEDALSLIEDLAVGPLQDLGLLD